MRVEPAPHVFRNEDRRQRAEDRRGTGEDRRIDPERDTYAEIPPRKPLIWIEPAFVAHVLGQGAPRAATPDEARRAYLQPEARTPLRPEAELKA